MALVSCDVILMAQKVRKAYLAAEEKDAQAAAKKGGKKAKHMTGSVFGGKVASVPDDTRSPVAMRMAPASFMAQFGGDPD